MITLLIPQPWGEFDGMVSVMDLDCEYREEGQGLSEKPDA